MQRRRQIIAPIPGPYEYTFAITNKYNELGGSSGILGKPLNGEIILPDGRGKVRHYEHGDIYWTSQTGANVIYGPILDRWKSLKAEQGFLGYPTSDVTTLGIDWSVSQFEHGAIYFRHTFMTIPGVHLQPITRVVQGHIFEKYVQLGAHKGFLGYPTSDEQVDPVTNVNPIEGRIQGFVNGRIYWSSDKGAHSVVSPILDSFLGWPQKTYFYPKSDEQKTADGRGRFQDFGSDMRYYVNPQSKAVPIYGDNLDKYLRLGGETGVLGYPIMYESQSTPAFWRFEHGAIYGIGHGLEVHGPIYDLYVSLGELHSSLLGWPTSDQQTTPDGQAIYNQFSGGGGIQGGLIYWYPHCMSSPKVITGTNIVPPSPCIIHSPPPAKPMINVTSPAAKKIDVIGSNFKLNKQVRIRVVFAPQVEKSYYASSDGNGGFNFTSPAELPSGYTLAVSATDGTTDPTDITGFLWSNTENITVS
ncbi:hypothetical protein [Bacillus paramycoides]|uniref:hypothetical protein n=1 Tax=Bacillus paramycoides TaxID=2026194 RepID=UPI002E1B0FD8|nr:hypothetical protein [Bacillus paramycoides]